MRARQTSWLRSAIGIAVKDLAIEWHSREILYTMGFLATLVVLIFSFALVAGQDSKLGPGTIAGILWVAVAVQTLVLIEQMTGAPRHRDPEPVA